MKTRIQICQTSKSADLCGSTGFYFTMIAVPLVFFYLFPSQDPPES